MSQALCCINYNYSKNLTEEINYPALRGLFKNYIALA